MEIEKLTITKPELCEATGLFLKSRGIDVKVTDVDKAYSYSTVYSVECEVKVRPLEEEPPKTEPLPEIAPLAPPAKVEEKPVHFEGKFPE